MPGFSADEWMQQRLQQRLTEDALRILPAEITGVDFCSNDYLGLSRTTDCSFIQPGKNYFGSTGSRLISGNYLSAELLENKIAAYHGYDAALLFNSGYAANTGLISALPQRNDTILYDELVHASIRDGIRLSLANSFSFAHNNVNDLVRRCQHAKGKVYVVTESVFSMDGDIAPLRQLSELAETYNWNLIVDEAHAVGVFGEKGEGLVAEFGLQKKVFAVVVTYGKAFAGHGASVLGSTLLRDYLINFSRPFIYTTALPPVVTAHLNQQYDSIFAAKSERSVLRELIGYFKKQLKNTDLEYIESESPIQAIIFGENKKTKNVATALERHGISAKAILYPTVPAGKERIRVCLHVFNTTEEIDLLFNIIYE